MNTPITNRNIELPENKSYEPQLFQSVDSSSIIHWLQLKSKENQRLHNSSKKQLQTEIRRTSYKVKLSRFNKNIRLSSMQEKQNQNYGVQTPEILLQYNGDEELLKENTFESFLRKKRIDNSQLKQKMKLFSNTVTERIKANIEKQISKQVTKIQQRKSTFGFKNKLKKQTVLHSNEEIDEGKVKKLKNFTISHMILQKLMGLMMEDPKYIKIRHDNEGLYKKLKQQMLNVIIRNEKIMEALAFFCNDLKQSTSSESTFRWSKLKEIQKRRKPFFMLKEQKNDELADQIYKTFQMLKELVEQSLKDFNRPQQAFHLQQQWDHRDDNVPILKSKKLPNSQNCVRITTVQRLKPLRYTGCFEES